MTDTTPRLSVADDKQVVRYLKNALSKAGYAVSFHSWLYPDYPGCATFVSRRFSFSKICQPFYENRGRAAAQLLTNYGNTAQRLKHI